jgi:hypothetical protein
MNYELHKFWLCDADGKLSTNGFNDNYKFESKNGLYAFEYVNGQLLISAHNYDYFYLASAGCRELRSCCLTLH